MLGFLGEFEVMIAAATIAVCLGVLFRRPIFSLLLIGILVMPFAWTWPSGDYRYRFEAERANYENATADDIVFGDEYRENSDGRSLTYWRWMAWGIDNAVGIVYDPDDRLSVKNDLKVFGEATHGVLFKVQRIEKCWFFVNHS
jgi:hypothetical protein